jgi:DNA-binding NtrC family response regulator
MPDRIVIVHDEPDFVDSLTAALKSAGHDVATFMDPEVGWNALDEAKRVELLITRVNFPPGKPNGVSLARMARYKRPVSGSCSPPSPNSLSTLMSWGEFVPMPASLPDVMLAVTRLLKSGAESTDHQLQRAALDVRAREQINPGADPIGA